MSVPKGQRSASKLDAQVACEELVRHTVHIMSSRRNFDEKYDDFHGRILDTAISIGQDVWEANGIRVNGPGDYVERRRLQDRAIREANTLLYLMTISRRLDHLKSGKYRHWAELARKARDLATAWRDSDAHRYGHLIREEGCSPPRLDALGKPQQRQQRRECEQHGHLQHQQRVQRQSRGAGSCRPTNGKAARSAADS